MFTVNGLPLLEDDLSILTELKRQLAESGIFRFADFKVGSSNIQTNCPIHSDGQESTPSCGIRTRGENSILAGTVHCFACGYTASLEKMISNCFGVDDDGQFGTKWLVKNFVSVSIESRKDIRFDANRKLEKSTVSYVSEDELKKYRFTHPYLYKRKLNDDVISMFDVGYDSCFEIKNNLNNMSKYKCVTFPVRDIEGRTLFIARRSVSSKFFHYPENVEKPVYGLYELNLLNTTHDDVIICESIFNAITCYVYGRVAVALLGLGTEYQYKQLQELSNRCLLLAFDGDEAGERAVTRLKKHLGGKKIIKRVYMPKGKDVNDLSKEEFEKIFEAAEMI